MSYTELQELAKKKIKEYDIELQGLADYIIREENLKPITIQVKNILRCGRARYRTRKITIPLWASDRGIEYLYYYLIHEVTHFVCLDRGIYCGHGKTFKEIESKWLKEFGLLPIYAKAYAKGLRNLNGDTIWKRSW